jgi:hypothetical protein
MAALGLAENGVALLTHIPAREHMLSTLVNTFRGGGVIWVVHVYLLLGGLYERALQLLRRARRI